MKSTGRRISHSGSWQFVVEDRLRLSLVPIARFHVFDDVNAAVFQAVPQVEEGEDLMLGHVTPVVNDDVEGSFPANPAHGFLLGLVAVHDLHAHPFAAAAVDVLL